MISVFLHKDTDNQVVFFNANDGEHYIVSSINDRSNEKLDRLMKSDALIMADMEELDSENERRCVFKDFGSDTDKNWVACVIKVDGRNSAYPDMNLKNATIQDLNNNYPFGHITQDILYMLFEEECQIPVELRAENILKSEVPNMLIGLRIARYNSGGNKKINIPFAIYWKNFLDQNMPIAKEVMKWASESIESDRHYPDNCRIAQYLPEDYTELEMQVANELLPEIRQECERAMLDMWNTERKNLEAKGCGDAAESAWEKVAFGW